MGATYSYGGRYVGRADVADVLDATFCSSDSSLLLDHTHIGGEDVTTAGNRTLMTSRSARSECYNNAQGIDVE